MQRAFLLLLLTFMVAAINCDETMHDRRVKEVANFLLMTKEEVQTCMNKNNITIYDADYVTTNDYSQTTDFDDRTLKVGCFFACLAEKNGLIPITVNTNVDDVKEKLKEMVRSGFHNPDNVAMLYQPVDLCVDQVKSETDDCQMSLKFILCIINEIKRMHESRYA